MSQPRHPPRDYQIAELTRGVEFPLPALKSRHLTVIAEFLMRAWQGLLETQEQVMRTQEEAEVTALMESQLLGFLDEGQEWSTLVSNVIRGKESFSFDGSSLEKRPDLSIFLTGRLLRFPLIVECKLIDKKARKEVALYGNNGLARFLNGEYAWYAWEAFMLAYVRDGSTIGDCLTPYLAARQNSAPDPFLTEQLSQTVTLPSQDLAHSRHGRRFPNKPRPHRHLALVAFLTPQCISALFGPAQDKTQSTGIPCVACEAEHTRSAHDCLGSTIQACHSWRQCATLNSYLWHSQGERLMA